MLALIAFYVALYILIGIIVLGLSDGFGDTGFQFDELYTAIGISVWPFIVLGYAIMFMGIGASFVVGFIARLVRNLR